MSSIMTFHTTTPCLRITYRIKSISVPHYGLQDPFVPFMTHANIPSQIPQSVHLKTTLHYSECGVPWIPSQLLYLSGPKEVRRIWGYLSMVPAIPSKTKIPGSTDSWWFSTTESVPVHPFSPHPYTCFAFAGHLACSFCLSFWNPE